METKLLLQPMKIYNANEREGYHMRIEAIIFIIIITTTIVTSWYIYNGKRKDIDELTMTTKSALRDPEFYERVYSEESYQELLELFDEFENQLKAFISILKDDERLRALDRLGIYFLSSEELNQGISFANEVNVYEGQIIRGSSDRLIRIIKNNLELISIIEKFSEKAIFHSAVSINRVNWSGEETWTVSFSIRHEHLPFIKSDTSEIHHAWASFIYTKSEVDLRQTIRKISDDWYMEIMTRD